MSVVRVVPPFEVFPDVDGDPLDSGSIYVGQAGLNPEVPGNQLPLFWDEALSIPASQPIRTLGGFPSRNGAPSNFYVDAISYSISVRNKNGSLVYADLFLNIGSVEFDSPILCKTVADMKAANMLLVNGKTVTAAEAATIANTGAVIETVWNNTTSKAGGAKYEFKTLAQHRMDIGNPSWVPDGFVDHYLFGGTTFVATMIISGVLRCEACGITGVADQTAVNAAIDYSSVNGKIPVMFSTLTITGPIILDDKRVPFIGDGIKTSTINYTGTGTAIQLLNTAGGDHSSEYVGEFQLVGSYGLGSIGMDCQFLRRSIFRNLFIKGFETGIKEVDCFVNFREKLYVADCKFCYHLVGANHNTTFLSCGATDFGDSFGGVGAGVLIQNNSGFDPNQSSIEFIGGDFEFGDGDAFDVTSNGTIILRGVYTERVKGIQFKCGGGNLIIDGGEHIIDPDNGGKLCSATHASSNIEFINKASITSSGVSSIYPALITGTTLGRIAFTSSTVWQKFLTTNNGTYSFDPFGPKIGYQNKLFRIFGKDFIGFAYTGTGTSTYTGNRIRLECTGTGNLSIHQQFKNKAYGIGERMVVVIAYRSNVSLNAAWVDNAGQTNPSVFGGIENTSGNLRVRVLANCPIPDSGKGWIEFYKASNWAVGEYLEIEYVLLFDDADINNGVFRAS